MQFAKLTKSIGFILLAKTFDAFAGENVCQNKYWLQSPIVEAKSGDGSGIGGTGVTLPVKSESLAQRSREEESGIGGTGIVGIISGFGSICVNGVEIHYDAATPIVENGITTNANLALGQTVSILATSDAQNYHAQEIHLLHEIKGAVESVDANNEIFHVLGQTVHLPETLLEKIAVGDKVVISGNRLSDGSVEATRIEKYDTLNTVSLIGSLEMDHSSNHFHIGNQKIELPQDHTSVKVGDEISVQGMLKDNVLHVEKIEQSPRWSFSNRVDQLLLQGYIRDNVKQQINMDGMKITIDKATDKMPKIGDHTGLWVKINEKGRMVFDHLDTGNMLPKHNHRHDLHDSFKQDPATNHYEHEHSERFPEVNHIDLDDKHPEINRIDLDDKRPEINRIDLDDKRPEFNHIDLDDKITVTRPEINHIEIEKPDVSRPDIDKPTLLRLENSRPNVPEYEHNEQNEHSERLDLK